MREKIVVVLSNDLIFKYAREIADEKNYDITFAQGELGDGLDMARAVLGQGEYCVFVSRGGTLQALEKHLDNPLVEIKISGSDHLKVLYPYVGSSKKVGLVGFENVIRGGLEIAEILSLDVIYQETFNETMVVDCIHKARAAGADVIIGDFLVTRRALAMGLSACRIDSGREAVRTALEEAAVLYAATQSERVKARRSKMILESIEEGIIAIDGHGIVTTFNLAASKLLGLDEQYATGKPITDIIQDTSMLEVLRTGQKNIGAIMDLGRYTIATSVRPIMVDSSIKGAVSTFRDITKIQQLEAKIRSAVIKTGHSAKRVFSDFVFKSPVMADLIGRAKKYAKAESTILIFGESGTGKEILAQAIHNESKRSREPFVAINCAALPDNLLESELFGYVAGSFTGARREGKKGLFEMAHGGTIFLDEISEMDLQVQSRILRVIQEKEVMRLGDDKVIPIDVRIIAATNKNLWQCVKKGGFRQDLFYRLNILNLNIPPLRERSGDIAPLLKDFLAHNSRKYHVAPSKPSKDDLAVLTKHNWPGNVRELQNVVERYIISGKWQIDDYSQEDLGPVDNDWGKESLEEIEAKIVRSVFEREGFNKSNTAKRLGISRTTLDKKLRG